MNTPRLGGERENVASKRPYGPVELLPKKAFRRTSLPSGVVVERVALGMIARHSANAAREATVHLNKMIDRGDLPARDLWACVVHDIHERGV